MPALSNTRTSMSSSLPLCNFVENIPTGRRIKVRTELPATSTTIVHSSSLGRTKNRKAKRQRLDRLNTNPHGVVGVCWPAAIMANHSSIDDPVATLSGRQAWPSIKVPTEVVDKKLVTHPHHPHYPHHTRRVTSFLSPTSPTSQ